MLPQADIDFAEALIKCQREFDRGDEWLDCLQATDQIAAVDCLD
jgi:hypothetical protein